MVSHMTKIMNHMTQIVSHVTQMANSYIATSCTSCARYSVHHLCSYLLSNYNRINIGLPVSSSPCVHSAVDLDFAAIPHTHPSLGVRPGHTRRDLVARSSRKRRPPSNRESLLLGVSGRQLTLRSRKKKNGRRRGGGEEGRISYVSTIFIICTIPSYLQDRKSVV